MFIKRKWKGLSVLVLSFVLLFVSMGLGGSQADASEQGMLSTNYVTENSVSIHFSNNVGRGTVSLSKDEEVYYTTSAYTFDYVVTSLQPNTTYLFQINGTTTMGNPIYDEMYVTTTAIPDEPETVGVDLGGQVGADASGSTLETTPTFDDTTSGGATTDSYYEGVKRTSGWDLVGSDKFYMPNTNGVRASWVGWMGSKVELPWNEEIGSVIYSTGGEFKIRVKGTSLSKVLSGTNNLMVDLYEYDSKWVSSKVKSWAIDPQSTDRDLILKNAGDYIDGDNKKAEFFIRVYSWYTPYGNYHTFNYWD